MKKSPLVKTQNYRIPFLALALCIALTVLACNPADKKSAPPPSTTSATDTLSPSDGAVTDTTIAKAEDTTKASDPISITAVPPGQDPVLCGGEALAPLMMGIAQKHTGVAYDLQDPSSQCSGIFQRFLGSVRDACADAATKTPPASQVDSRQQGKWYYDNKALIQIKDPIAQAELIRPGAVMFYGKMDQDFYNSNPVEKFWSREEGINHVGVVVDVKRDESSGEIQSYSLFHGRKPGVASGISSADDYMHRRAGKGVPAFGNGTDPWIGVAAIVVQEH